MGRGSYLVGVLGFLVVAAIPPLAAGSGTVASATLELRGTLRLESLRAGTCPAGTPETIVCPARTGAGLVPGIGRVTEAYTYVADTTPAGCPAGFNKILGYSVHWVVAGKGEIHFAVAENPDCLGEAAAFTAPQSFTITGGTGLYAGASGNGRVERALARTNTGAVGPETWAGTLNVAGLEFDVTPPRISGARSKIVRVARRVKRARVTYVVTATDAVDGSVPVACQPASGSRFRVGRTVVRCTATDASGNTASAAFTVTIRRR